MHNTIIIPKDNAHLRIQHDKYYNFKSKRKLYLSSWMVYNIMYNIPFYLIFIMNRIIENQQNGEVKILIRRNKILNQHNAHGNILYYNYNYT